MEAIAEVVVAVVPVTLQPVTVKQLEVVIVDTLVLKSVVELLILLAIIRVELRQKLLAMGIVDRKVFKGGQGILYSFRHAVCYRRRCSATC